MNFKNMMDLFCSKITFLKIKHPQEILEQEIIQPLFEYFQEPELNIYLFTPVFCFVFWLYSILVPQPGIEPGLVVKAPSPNHWTTRKFPFHSSF